MENIIKSIENSLQGKNWYSALVLSLILPDICAKLEGSDESSSARYPKWFESYLGQKYNGFLSGNDCYALRCAFLHEGSSSIESQRAKDVLDHFVFVANGAHCNKFSNCHFGDPKYDGKDFLQLSVNHFCQDMIAATKQWLNDPAINKNLSEMLEIHENGFSIGRAIKIQ
ncbi:MAG: hypothetical protein KJZ57_02165 [Anaerolineales bacterium]|uniref:Uncharacterized protein n=1 Tax=candidate division WWE3 bacterium TaxID=2053526 RepID=A0A928TPK2_UNCKA|nr:hypothetical protein [candidate division WWE3 bacterium]MCL4822999.1 hypothetical protein [Anaerolineales bacterium]